MAATRITDIIEPSVWNPYMLQRTTELSELISSGIVVKDAEMDILATKGSRTINMPYFKDLTGTDELLSDTSPLNVYNITTDKDIARILYRGKAFGSNELTTAISGADPMEAIASLVASWWVRREQDVLLSTLAGVFADNSDNDSGDLVHTAAAEASANVKAYNDANPTVMNPIAILDAKGKLGDNAGKLTAIMMHSKQYLDLQKQNVIDFIPASDSRVQLPYYMSYRVIVDDDIPTRVGTGAGTPTVYKAFLFGEGAIARGEGAPETPVETDRDSLQGDDILVTRRHFLLHPRGIAWQEDTVTDGISPSNANLALAANWDRVYEKKAIRMVMLETN